MIASSINGAMLFDVAQVTMNVLSFRPLARSDFPLLQRWLSEPHVHAWWHEALDLAGLEHKYGPRIDGSEPTHVFIIERESRPIGWIQWYRWSDYPRHAARVEAEPDAAGIDLSIGETSALGKGFGSSAIREFSLKVVSAVPGIAAIVTDPEERNGRSCRAFEKAGFIPVRTVELEGENVRRRIMRLSLLAVPSPGTGC
jgi:RimJ/RimL family protein N-acetyltransferase